MSAFMGKMIETSELKRFHYLQYDKVCWLERQKLLRIESLAALVTEVTQVPEVNCSNSREFSTATPVSKCVKDVVSTLPYYSELF